MAIQRVTTETVSDGEQRDFIAVPAPEMATALLNVLASVVGVAPQCDTPAGMRKVSEAAGKDLLLLMREYRRQTRIVSDTVN